MYNNDRKVFFCAVIVFIVIIAIFYIKNTDFDKFIQKNEYNDIFENNIDDQIEQEDYTDIEIENDIYTDEITEDNIDDEIYDINGQFLMPIEDTFTITGKGTVVTGKILRGSIKVGDSIQIIGLGKSVINTTVSGIEFFRKEQESAKAGENVGIVLSNIPRSEVERGQVLAFPNSIREYSKFDADITILSEEEGGKQLSNNSTYYFKTIDITGKYTTPNNLDITPGINTSITIELTKPVAMEIGMSFDIREGGKKIGDGIITKIY